MRRLALVGTVVALTAVAACGGSSGSKTTKASAGSSTTASAPKDPVKIAFMGIETGANAAPDRHNALELAIAEINAKGGAAGHQLEYTAYDTGILPPQTVTAVTKAVSDHPTALIGLQVSSGVQAAGPLLKQSGLPIMQAASNNATDFSQLGVGNMFRVIDTVKIEADATAKFIISRHPTTVGLWDDSNTNGKVLTTDIEAALTAAGIKNIIKRETAQSATDSTEAVLAMKGADIIATNGFSGSESLFLKQAYQNGVTAPIVLSYGGNVIYGLNLAPKEAFEKSFYQSVCDPDAVHNAATDAFVKAYKAKYPSATQVASGQPQIYDAVYLLKAAIEKTGGNLAPAALVDALKSLSYDGICGTYKADANNNMSHSAYIVSFAGGTKSMVARYDDLPSSP